MTFINTSTTKFPNKGQNYSYYCCGCYYYYYYIRGKKKYFMFLVVLVCLSAGEQHYSKSYERISVKFDHFYMHISSLQYLTEKRRNGTSRFYFSNINLT